MPVALISDEVAPPKEVVQGERSGSPRRGVHVVGRDRHHRGSQLRRGLGRGPLGVAEI